MRRVLRMASGLRGIGARLGMALVVGVALSVVGVSSTAEEVRAQTDPDPSLAGGFTAAEKEALEAIYNATGGANWTNKTNWMSDKPLGEWFGVHDSVEVEPGIEVPAGFHGSQNPPQKRVYALRLPNNNLRGELPDDDPIQGQIRRYTEVPSLNNLSRLRVLDLSGNRLSGDVPGDIGNLRHLKVLLLQNNNFNSATPPRWDFGTDDLTADPGDPDNFLYSNIQTINLSNSGIGPWQTGLANKLARTSGRRPWASLRHFYWANGRGFDSRQIREGIGNLPKLEVLDLSNNGHIDELRDEFARLDSLRELYLHGNRMDGKLIPDAWAASGKLQNLEVLELQGNEFDNIGSLAAFVKDRPNLNVLRLEKNSGLAGASIPAELAAHAGLEVVRLDGNGLTGDLPADWNASELKVLRLENNELSGAVPASLASAGKLEELRLDQNKLNGDLPTDWSGAAALRKLRLDRNELTGSVPSSLGSAAKLEVVRLDNNQLDGLLPGQFADLPELKTLMLHRNTISGSLPNSFGIAGKFPKLEKLTLDHNNLEGTVPVGLLQRDSTVFLSLTHNGFSGIDGAIGAGTGTALEELLFEENELTAVPANLTRSSGMKRLSFNYNKIGGQIPAQLGSLSSLEDLYLNDNEFEGAIPSALGSLAELQELNLGQNRLTGGIPMELTPQTGSKIQKLHLYRNQLDGDLPAELGLLSRLVELDLHDNQMTGNVRREFGVLSDLEELNLSGNQLDGAIPGVLSSATKLTKLNLGGNGLTGAIPMELGSLSDLQELNLSGNELEGAIPMELGNLDEVRTFNLSGNKLTSIPAELVRLDEVVEFDLSDNAFATALPSGVGAGAPKLEKLYLNNNQFTGGIPDNLFPDAGVTNLKELNLGHNQLTGGIAVTGIANIARSAELILLNNNMLDGRIESQFLGFNSLKRLDLSHNQFTGGISDSAVAEFRPDQTNFEELNLHNNMFSGRVPNKLTEYGSLKTLTLRNNMFDCIPAGLLDGTPPNLDEHGLDVCQ